MKSKIPVKRVKICPKLLCMVVPGGWNKWDGETLETKGVGGSETFAIKYSEHIAAEGEYKVIVFCDCFAEKEYKNVLYKPVNEYVNFLCSTHIDVCIVNRYTEYLPVTLENDCAPDKVYLVLHDLFRDGESIPMSNKLTGVFCVSEWHRLRFNGTFPKLQNKSGVISLGMDTDNFLPSNNKILLSRGLRSLTDKFNFIYSSFPNRGLLYLLRMFPKITQNYPNAVLNVFSDTKLEFVRKNFSDDMDEIERMIEEQDNVINHGWVDKKTLNTYWNEADIWFYPCVFEETCCLTALEAAASKTLVISNNNAGLENTVNDRGVVIRGDPRDEKWQTIALNKIYDILNGTTDVTDYIERNFEWVKGRSHNKVVRSFVRNFF